MKLQALCLKARGDGGIATRPADLLIVAEGHVDRALGLMATFQKPLHRLENGRHRPFHVERAPPPYITALHGPRECGQMPACFILARNHIHMRHDQHRRQIGVAAGPAKQQGVIEQLTGQRCAQLGISGLHILTQCDERHAVVILGVLMRNRGESQQLGKPLLSPCARDHRHGLHVLQLFARMPPYIDRGTCDQHQQCPSEHPKCPAQQTFTRRFSHVGLSRRSGSLRQGRRRHRLGDLDEGFVRLDQVE